MEKSKIKAGSVWRALRYLTVPGSEEGEAEFIKGKKYQSMRDGTIRSQQGSNIIIGDSIRVAFFEEVKPTPIFEKGEILEQVHKQIAKTESDLVNHPPHYTAGKVESIEALESALGEAGFEGFLSGNVIKYMWRYKHKNGVQDLKKAQWYLQKLIDQLEQ